MHIEKAPDNQNNQILTGKVFVITGSLEHFENRNQLKERIEQLGGRVTGSVTGKTSYRLITTAILRHLKIRLRQNWEFL